MKLGKFKNILESMKAREEWEQDAYNLGIDLFNIPNDPYEWVIELLNEIYPNSADVIEYFCWELNFGAKYTDGCFTDEKGRLQNIGSIEALWLYLESREGEI